MSQIIIITIHNKDNWGDAHLGAEESFNGHLSTHWQEHRSTSQTRILGDFDYTQEILNADTKSVTVLAASNNGKYNFKIGGCASRKELTSNKPKNTIHKSRLVVWKLRKVTGNYLNEEQCVWNTERNSVNNPTLLSLRLSGMQGLCSKCYLLGTNH